MRPADPLIADIKRHSLEDGPGIRSVVFFKGCPLRCVFCHNPETQDPRPEIAFSARDCIGCGACARVCPQHAIDLHLPARIDRARCARCGRCAEACPGRGLRLIGTRYAAPALASALLRDRAFYRHSGGGVTLSGGECTLYPDYLEELLGLLKQESLHVALQTSGAFDYEAVARKVLPRVDLVYYDLKLAGEAAHRRFTGGTNAVILRNFRRLLRDHSTPVHARVPLVPGVTATDANLASLARLLREAGAARVTLLPYNPLGLAMHDRLGRPRPALPETLLSPAEEDRLYSAFQAMLAS